MDFCSDNDVLQTTDDISTENAAPDNVRQWLKLIQDENALTSQDFMSTSESNSCTDTSTISQITLHTRDYMDSFVAAERPKDLASDFSDTAAEDKGSTSFSREDILQKFSLARFVSQEHGLGMCINNS